MEHFDGWIGGIGTDARAADRGRALAALAAGPVHRRHARAPRRAPGAARAVGRRSPSSSGATYTFDEVRLVPVELYSEDGEPVLAAGGLTSRSAWDAGAARAPAARRAARLATDPRWIAAHRRDRPPGAAGRAHGGQRRERPHRVLRRPRPAPHRRRPHRPRRRRPGWAAARVARRCGSGSARPPRRRPGCGSRPSSTGAESPGTDRGPAHSKGSRGPDPLRRFRCPVVCCCPSSPPRACCSSRSPPPPSRGEVCGPAHRRGPGGAGVRPRHRRSRRCSAAAATTGSGASTGAPVSLDAIARTLASPAPPVYDERSNTWIHTGEVVVVLSAGDGQVVTARPVPR